MTRSKNEQQDKGGKRCTRGDAAAQLLSSDYPHPEGGRDPVARFESTLGGVSEAAKHRFYAQNFAEMLSPA